MAMLDLMPLVSSGLASCAALGVAIPWVGDLMGTLDGFGTSWRTPLSLEPTHQNSTGYSVGRRTDDTRFHPRWKPLPTGLTLPVHPLTSLVVCPGAGDIPAVAASSCLSAHCLPDAYTALTWALPNGTHPTSLFLSAGLDLFPHLRHCLLCSIWGCNYLWAFSGSFLFRWDFLREGRRMDE